MVIKVYVALISCSQEIKKNQQRTVMILESKNISYTAIDITDPGNEEAKDYMVGNAIPKEGFKIPVTPQIFNEADYCGDFDGLDMANECDTLGDFLKLSEEEKSNVRIGITGIGPKAPNQSQEENKLTNGVSTASREELLAKEIAPVEEKNKLQSTPVEEAKPVEVPVPVTSEESKAVVEESPVSPESAPAENTELPTPVVSETSPTAAAPETPAPAAPETPAPAAPETPAPAVPETPAPAVPETPTPNAPISAASVPAPAPVISPKLPVLPLDDEDETTSEEFTSSDEETESD